MKKHGHYCKVCGEYKANEKFSGKGHAFPPVTETRSLWSSAACFAAGCCSLEKMVCSMEVFGGAMANETV